MGCFYIICKIFGFVEINIVKGYSLFILYFEFNIFSSFSSVSWHNTSFLVQ